MSTENDESWIGVDLDSTLAFYDMWRGPEHIGEPVPDMLARVLRWLKEGKRVKIFTARAETPENIPYVEKWCLDYIGQVLPVTNVKDQNMIQLWDDRAVRVEANTGKIIGHEVGMENRLLVRYNQVSVESLGFGATKLTSDVAKNLSSFLSGVTDYIGTATKPIATHLRFDFFSDDDVENLLAKTNYVSLSPVEVYVPAGMVVDMVTFLKTLERTQDILNGLQDAILKPCQTYFSNLLATPETMASVQNNEMVKQVKLYLDNLEKSATETNKCYSKHSSNTRREHGDVFKRNSDWKTSCDLLSDVTDAYNRFPPGKVWETVNGICSVLDRLVLRMGQQPDVYRLTGITSSDLADVTLYLGKVIEFYAAYSFILQMASATMRDNVNVYRKALAD